MLKKTDGSWVRPERRKKEGVATQEVLVNYAACFSRLRMKKNKKGLRKVCANGQRRSHTEAVSTQGTKRSMGDMRVVGVFSREVRR